jgi:hypothetical protein
MSTPPVVAPPAVDDMAPVPPPWIEPGPLRDALDFMARPVDGQKTLYTLYAEADARAVSLRRRHYRVASCAAFLGLAAVLLALYQLAHWALAPDPHHVPEWLTVVDILVHVVTMPIAAAALFFGVYSFYAWALRRAGWQRPWLTRLIAVAAFVGLLGLTLPLWLPLVSHPDFRTPAGEFALAAIALFAVVYGIWTGAQRDWILNRSKAERLRQLKYRFLALPALWTTNDEARARCEEEFQDEVRTVAAMTFEALHGWPRAQLGSLSRLTGDAKLEDARGALDQLRRYYREMRLWNQITYFSEGAEPRSAPIRLTRILPASIFFLASIIVGLHVTLDLGMHFAKVPHESRVLVGVPLLFLAVGLPALGAALRTWRLSQEFDRNALRSQATAAALVAFAERLRGEPAAAELLRTLGDCEDIFDSDHREWLRLMIEAEWFG